MFKSITCRVGIWKLKIIDDVHKFTDEVWQGVKECLPQDVFPTVHRNTYRYVRMYVRDLLLHLYQQKIYGPKIKIFVFYFSLFLFGRPITAFRFGIATESGPTALGKSSHVLEDINERKEEEIGTGTNVTCKSTGICMSQSKYYDRLF